jgi:hypothetical protein
MVVIFQISFRSFSIALIRMSYTSSMLLSIVAYLVAFIHAHHCTRSCLVRKEPEHAAVSVDDDVHLPDFCECCVGNYRQPPEQQGKQLSILHPCSIE